MSRFYFNSSPPPPPNPSLLRNKNIEPNLLAVVLKGEGWGKKIVKSLAWRFNFLAIRLGDK